MYDSSGNFALTTTIILGLIGNGALAGFGVVAYADYKEDGKIFNGSVGYKTYIFGTLLGGTIGGIIGYFLAPLIAVLLTSTCTIGGGFALSGISGSVGWGIAISLSGELSLIGAISLTGILSGAIVMAAKWKPGSWPGDDFEWRGQLPIGGDKGAWVNPNTGDSLHPDLNHPMPIGPHWDWINKVLDIIKRIFR